MVRLSPRTAAAAASVDKASARKVRQLAAQKQKRADEVAGKRCVCSMPQRCAMRVWLSFYEYAYPVDIPGNFKAQQARALAARSKKRADEAADNHLHVFFWLLTVAVRVRTSIYRAK